MRYLPLVVWLVWPHISTAAEDRAYIREFYDARKIKVSDPAGALEAMLRSFHHAVTAGNADYATSAGVEACYLIHDSGKTVEAGKLAREVIDSIEALPTDFTNNDALRRAQIFGFIETGLQMEGRIGDAWRANRATAEAEVARRLQGETAG